MRDTENVTMTKKKKNQMKSPKLTFDKSCDFCLTDPLILRNLDASLQMQARTRSEKKLCIEEFMEEERVRNEPAIEIKSCVDIIFDGVDCFVDENLRI